MKLEVTIARFLSHTKGAVAIIGVLAGVVFFGASPVSAFSGAGSGTTGDPYKIGSCSQLQQIANDKTAHYIVIASFDCTGVDFPTIDGEFTGTLDGQSYSIYNLTITGSQRGLFQQVTGATIENLRIASGLITNASGAGSFAGISDNSTFINVHSAMNIVGSGSSSLVGGLVGYTDNGTIISRSSYSGTLTSTTYVGGLVGMMYDHPSNLISNSFFNGVLNLVDRIFPVPDPGYVAGGFVGVLYGGRIEDSYSSGAINISDGASGVGGLVGLSYDGVFENLFAASPITTGVSGPAYNGGAFGIYYSQSPYSSNSTNVHFDRSVAGWDCTGYDDGITGCTAQNVSNAAPNFFRNNAANPPMSSWNFASIWQLTTSYPTLQSLAVFEARAAILGAPNTGLVHYGGTFWILVVAGALLAAGASYGLLPRPIRCLVSQAGYNKPKGRSWWGR